MKSTITLTILAAVAHARFGQEQIPIEAIGNVQGGEPGAAPTIAGAAISDLLAGSNACAKLQRADQILAELGAGDDAIAAAIGMVSAEKNVNPFVQQQPAICNDPTLPATEILRGRTPLVDPAFTNADVANALSVATAATPIDATGKSVADLLIENGFTDFLAQGLDGVMGAVGNAAGDAAATAIDTAVAAVNTASAAIDTAVAVATNACAAAVAEALASASSAQAVTATVTEAAVATKTGAANDTVAAVRANATATQAIAAAVDTAAAAKGDAGGADFGTCDPTIKFEGGLGGRPPTEFTFQSQDPAIVAIQQEALNPNIITNRICDELVNQCGASADAIATCEDAQAQILALGTRDVTTAETWNELLGFAGTVTNPDGGPATPEEAGAAARMRMARRRRSFHA